MALLYPSFCELQLIMNQFPATQLASVLLCLLTITTPVACQTKTSPSGAPADPSAVKLPAKEVTSLWTRTGGEDWPSFLGPRGDGTSTEKGIKPELWQPHPKLLWQLPLGMSYGGPAVVKGRLLQFDRIGRSERLRCINAESGQELWSWKDVVEYQDMYGYNNGPRCMPIVDNDLVYLYGVSGKLSCVSLGEGKTIWQRDLNSEFGVVQNFFGVASAPYIWKDSLIVMVGGSPEESQRVPSGRLDMVQPAGSAILSLDKTSGKLNYKVGNDLASYSSPTVKRVGDRELGLAFVRSGLLGWDVASGKELFTYPWRAETLESVNAAQPLVFGQQIFLSETYAIGSVLLELEGDAPKVVWQDGDTRRTQSFRAHWSTPILVDGYLYGCSGRNQPDADFRCVRLSDAKVMWTERRHERASVLSVDGYLVVLYEDGALELIKPNTEKYDKVAAAHMGEIQGENGLPLLDPPCWAAPVLSHGLLYVRGNSSLLCFDLIPTP